MAQTTTASYGIDMDKGLPGLIADVRPHTVVSYAAEGAVAFGHAVTYGTIPAKQCKEVRSNAVKLVGFAVKTETIITAPGATPAYADKDAVSVLKGGAIWANVSATVVPGEQVYVNVADGTVTNVATNNLATNWRFMTNAASGELAIIESY